MKKKITNWRKELHNAMAELRPSDWYYNWVENLLEEVIDSFYDEMPHNTNWLKQYKKNLKEAYEIKQSDIPQKPFHN